MGDGSPPDEESPSGEDVPLGGSSRARAESPIDEEGPTDGDRSSDGNDGGGFLHELLAGLAIAAVLALLLFGISGVWPPMVAVESPSMEPNFYRGDLVLVVEEGRFGSQAAVSGTGVVTRRAGEEVGHTSFGAPGDVIVFRPGGRNGGAPIIHRAEFWVNDSENWYDKADPTYVSGENCEAVPNCPAPHAGFVTKGDNNERYDQVGGVSAPVRPSWVRGRAEYKVPYLGRVRLAFGRLGPGPVLGTSYSGVAVAHTSTTSTNATSIDPVSSTWTTADPSTPTTA